MRILSMDHSAPARFSSLVEVKLGFWKLYGTSLKYKHIMLNRKTSYCMDEFWDVLFLFKRAVYKIKQNKKAKLCSQKANEYQCESEKDKVASQQNISSLFLDYHVSRRHGKIHDSNSSLHFMVYNSSSLRKSPV